jgi:hypothetical protein
MLRTAVVLLSCAALGAFAVPARGVTVSYSANLSTSKGNSVPLKNLNSLSRVVKTRGARAGAVHRKEPPRRWRRVTPFQAAHSCS